MSNREMDVYLERARQNGKISEALEQALADAAVPVRSGAAVALARRYAELIDEPVPAGKYRIPLQYLAKVFESYVVTHTMTPTELRGMEAAEVTITNALAEHSVTSDLGPKLLQALTALNLTLPAEKAAPNPEAKRAKPTEPLDTERAEAQRLKIVR